MRSKQLCAEVATVARRTATRDVSTSALVMHVRAVDYTVRTATPAFIGDAALDALAPGRATTLAAIELCLAGLWQRAVDGCDGYVIADAELVDHLAAARPLGRVTAAARWLWRELTSERFIPL